MAGKLVWRDVLVLLFIVLALTSVALLAIGVTLSSEEARAIFSSRQWLAWGVSVVAISFLALMLLKSRRQIAHERNRLNAFLQSAGEGIVAIDRDFTITLWNKQAEIITGYSSIDVLGKPLRDAMVFYRERDRAEDLTFVQEALLYGEPREMPERMYIVRKDGTEVPVGDSAAPLKNASGEVSGCIIIFRDATPERKQQALRSEFAYASHQLKTPVTKALWSIEAALDKDVPDKEDLTIAHSALKSIRKLSSEIVDVSEIDQNLVRVKLTAVPVADVIQQAFSLTKECLEQIGATVNTDALEPGVTVMADPKLLTRACHEVLYNASLYGERNGPVVISTRRQDDRIVMSIQNKGIGIPDDEQPLVFTKFFRGSNVNKSQVPGAGLGLYIMKHYIELMGGKVWFTSAPEPGSVFYVSLPSARVRDASVAES